MTAYRIDYEHADTGVTNVEHATDRQDAMARAYRLSKRHGTAYAIAHDGDKDTGQRVYHSGAFSHQDDQF